MRSPPARRHQRLRVGGIKVEFRIQNSECRIQRAHGITIDPVSRYTMLDGALGLKYPIFLLLASATIAPFAASQVKNPAMDFERRLVQARALPIQDVRLTGGPLKHAQ